MLTIFQTKLADETAAASYAFTSEQQTVVNTLLPKYQAQMDILLKMSPEQKTSFFTLYAKAATAGQQECVICNFFNM